jgi:hypothetical protein
MIKIAYLVLLLAVVVVPAYADVAPPENYVETCTMEKQQTGNLECFPCSGTMSAGAADSGIEGMCEDPATYEADGYEKKCQTAGASNWTEIWCRPGSADPVADASTEESKTSSDGDGCSVTAAGRENTIGVFDCLLILLN